MALRVWLIGLVLGNVACSGNTAPSDSESRNDAASDAAVNTASADAGGASNAASGGSSSGGSSSGGSSSTGSASGGSAGNGSASDGWSAVTTGQGGSGQGGSGQATVGGTSNHDQPNCDTYFDEVDRSCQTADDCELVQHQTDCCGSILVMGIASTAVPDFSAVEQYCAARYPLCGCAGRGLALEDGTLVDYGSSNFAAECVEGRCRSHSLEATSACGPELKCTTAQYCQELVGGPAGSEPSYTCVSLGDCQDCACLNVVGCQCSESEGAINVFCAAP